MSNTFLSSIIQRKQTCYFISPHLDDAVFSAGLLIRHLSMKIKTVVINVFTKADKKPYTLSAKTFLRQCGYTDAETLYIDREKEDAAVLQNLANKVINLGFVDALWRKKQQQTIFSKFFSNIPELRAIYPTYLFHIKRGKVAKEDEQTVLSIRRKLSEIITPSNAVIFCPFAIGNHIDHVVTRISCERTFSDLIYWSDFPYNLHSTPNIHDLISYQFDEKLNEKKKLLQGYATQYMAMFGKGLLLKPEIFYLKNK